MNNSHIKWLMLLILIYQLIDSNKVIIIEEICRLIKELMIFVLMKLIILNIFITVFINFISWILDS